MIVPPGRLIAIHIASDAGAPLQAVAAATLRPGQGIDGDRYSRKAGTFSGYPGDHELTLIEQETLDAVGRSSGIPFAPGQTRRNLTTADIPLNPLVGRRFRIGDVLCEGTRLCEPCAVLESRLDRHGLVGALTGRGGLRARILEEGKIHVSDAIVVLDD